MYLGQSWFHQTISFHHPILEKGHPKCPDLLLKNSSWTWKCESLQDTSPPRRTPHYHTLEPPAPLFTIVTSPQSWLKWKSVKIKTWKYFGRKKLKQASAVIINVKQPVPFFSGSRQNWIFTSYTYRQLDFSPPGHMYHSDKQGVQDP